MAFLIDTDIIIYSLKGHEKVRAWFEANKNLPKFISAVTYGELVYGAKKSPHPEKNLAAARRIAGLFPVLEVTKDIMEFFGSLKAGLRSAGRTLDDMDLIIAASAIHMNLTLVTNNDRHFSRVPDLLLENWRNV